MRIRLASLLVLTALLTSPSVGKDKKKSSLPEYVLRATTALVVINPDASDRLDQPRSNATARDNVEKALMQWGRLRLVSDGQESDLVIAIRTGSGNSMVPALKGAPVTNRPGVIQPTDDGVRLGGQHGPPPPSSDPSMDPNNPRIGKNDGGSEDMFEVYRGGQQYPLDASAVWRYVAKDCLSAPNVSAVEEFRKAVANAEKLQQQTKKP